MNGATTEPWDGTEASRAAVSECRDLASGELESLFEPWGIEVVVVPDDQAIPGSYWGEPEAGILARRLYVRADTPVHSALHEGCHLVCMGADRRAAVERDAGGDELEEGAVCFLQVTLADRLSGVGADRLCADMDAWGYSFRTGSTRRWFEEDAEDAREWLARRGISAVAKRGPAMARIPPLCDSS